MRTPTVTALLVALVLAAPAAGSRPPRAAEAKAIRAAVAAFVAQPSSPAAKDNRVASISVSTLDPRYAAVRLVSRSAGPSELVLHAGLGTWWEVGFGSSLGCDTAPKAVLADLHVGCTPPDGVAWIANCGPLVSEPATLVLACADANYEVARLAWHGWGRATASATAVARANDCTPSCAAGRFHSYRVRVTATRLRACGRARIYTRLTLVYPGPRPAGIAKRDVHVLGC